MIDWKYGLINLVGGLPFVLTWIFFASKIMLGLGVVFMLIFILGQFWLFSDKSSYHPRFHPTTIKHFDGIFRLAMTVVMLVMLWLLPAKFTNYYLPALIMLANVIPAFFTKESAKEEK
ncbi:hypothetical protein LFYK43_00400 [Ligilactobacillus salitolerans]|uniref:Uncharacterized protein n=1 Tax=Ligilactobacillus salitolerans TaxID=1808352 RepID=A0A401IPW4_9LACO|nr:hypothetical protein [Ligilactobacillus salitolerans]GBG93581.1 hypothetical protein LFYK43_00400 [Ligilactobacillus salitolerans]